MDEDDFIGLIFDVFVIWLVGFFLVFVVMEIIGFWFLWEIEIFKYRFKFLNFVLKWCFLIWFLLLDLELK